MKPSRKHVRGRPSGRRRGGVALAGARPRPILLAGVLSRRRLALGGGARPGPFLVPAEVAPSSLGGLGVFARAPLARGTLVADLTAGAHLICEADYREAQRAGNPRVLRSAVRWLGDHFLCCEESDEADYLNHSFSPNILYLWGSCIALDDIAAGEELTVDYRYFLAERDETRFIDGPTGRLVDGLDASRALLGSVLRLLALAGASRAAA